MPASSHLPLAAIQRCSSISHRWASSSRWLKQTRAATGRRMHLATALLRINSCEQASGVWLRAKSNCLAAVFRCVCCKLGLLPNLGTPLKAPAPRGTPWL